MKLWLAFVATVGLVIAGITNGGGGATITPPYVIGADGIYYGPLIPIIKPGNTSFVWRNQGTATTTTTNGSIFMNSGAGTGAYSWRIQETNAPVTPYIVDMAFNAIAVGGNTGIFAGMVLVSAGGALETYCIGFDNLSVTGYTWISVTGAATNLFQASGTISNAFRNQPVMLRLKDDGVNRTFWIGSDYSTAGWMQVFTEVTGTFTATKIGIGVTTNLGAAASVGMTVYSFQIH